jgi:hypothetical protein
MRNILLLIFILFFIPLYAISEEVGGMKNYKPKYPGQDVPWNKNEIFVLVAGKFFSYDKIKARDYISSMSVMIDSIKNCRKSKHEVSIPLSNMVLKLNVSYPIGKICNITIANYVKGRIFERLTCKVENNNSFKKIMKDSVYRIERYTGFEHFSNDANWALFNNCK